MKKQTLFTLLLAITAMMWADRASAQKVEIEGVEIDLKKDASLTGDWLKSGTVEWIAKTKTLVLENANIVSEGINGKFILISDMEDITILLLGENSITNTHVHIPIYFSRSKGIIIGGGSLKTETKSNVGLYITNSTVTLIGCSVETNEAIGNNSSYKANAHIVIVNSRVKAREFRHMNTIRLRYSHIQEPENGKIVNHTYNGGTGQIIHCRDGFVIAPGNKPDSQHTAILQPSHTAKPDVKGIYNIAGERMIDDLDALPAGVYIVNGKKVIKD